MPLFEENEDNVCEGCMTRNTGSNFSHPGFCKSCMSAMLDVPTDDVLAGQDKLTGVLAKNADEKVGALRSWKDTDGAEIEIMLPMPPGFTKADVRVKVSVTKLIVATGDRKLLFVDPLYDHVVPDETVWCLLPATDGSTVMQLSLSKLHPGTRWGKTLCQEDGVFTCWKSNLLKDAESKPPASPEEKLPADVSDAPPAAASVPPSAPPTEVVGAPSASLTKDGKLKPRFTLRDDGEEVELNLPLPPGVDKKADLRIVATATSLNVDTTHECATGARQLLYVSKLIGRIVPDELVWTIESAKDGQRHVQFQLVKVESEVATTWSTLVAEGGRFSSWTQEL